MGCTKWVEQQVDVFIMYVSMVNSDKNNGSTIYMVNRGGQHRGRKITERITGSLSLNAVVRDFENIDSIINNYILLL